MKNIHHMRISRQKCGFATLTLSVFFIASSCSEDLFDSGMNSGLQKNGISILVSQQKAGRLTVKSECENTEQVINSSPVLLLSEDGKDSLMFQISEKPQEQNFTHSITASTKSAEINSDNITSIAAIQMAAFKAVDNSEYIPTTDLKFTDTWKVDKQISYWKPFSEGETFDLFWPSYELNFFAWSMRNKDDMDLLTSKTFDAQNGIISFTYNMPAPDSTNKRDADNQSDLMLASIKTSRPENNEVALEFDHTLSAVRFEVGKTNDIIIKSITLENVLSEGTCTYDLNDSVKWKDLKSPMTFVQTYTDEEGSIHEDLAYKPSGGKEPQKVGSESTTFMFIPQTSGVSYNTPIHLKVVLNLKGSDDDLTLEADLSSEMASWRAGYEYKYTLNTTNELDIEVDDSVTDNVKSNLTITNTGGKDAYVRVLVTGAWVNEDGDIVTTWDPSDESIGVFSPKIFAATPVLNENWVKGADGFYYYTKVLPAGAVTQTKLFDSYVVNEAGKPKGLKLSDHLEIDIVSQAVIADEDKAAITTAWGETAAGYMTE